MSSFYYSVLLGTGLYFVLLYLLSQRRLLPKGCFPNIEKDWFYTDDGGSETRLINYALSRGEEIAAYFLFVFSYSLLASPLVLTLSGAAILLVSSIMDLKWQMLPDICSFAALLIGIMYGFQSGHQISVIVVVVSICIYDTFVGDSDRFGGADVIFIAGALAYFGFCSWLIFLIVSCMAGVLLKILFWVSKKDKLSERGIPFIPAVTVGAVITYWIDTSWGFMYSLDLSDIMWLISNFNYSF